MNNKKINQKNKFKEFELAIDILERKIKELLLENKTLKEKLLNGKTNV